MNSSERYKENDKCKSTTRIFKLHNENMLKPNEDKLMLFHRAAYQNKTGLLYKPIN